MVFGTAHDWSDAVVSTGSARQSSGALDLAPRPGDIGRRDGRLLWGTRSLATRSIVAGALGLGAAVFLAGWVQQGRPEAFWFARRLATIWFWQLVQSASCVAAGHWAVSRWIPARERGRLETLALAFPVGVVLFVLGMYVGGFLRLFGPVFAVAWPAVLLIASAPATLRAWSSARAAASKQGGLLPLVDLRGLPLVASLLGLLALGLLYLGAMTPAAVNYDSAWMHLVIAQEYARAGHIIGFPGDWTKGEVHLGSVLNTWAFLVPGLDMPALRWMMALHTEFVAVVWTLVGVAAAARWLARRDARATWVMFFLFPGIYVYDNNIGGAADHYLALFMAPLLLMTARALRRFARGPCFLWGALAGAALLTKYQSCYVLLPIAIWTGIRVGRLALGWRRGDPSIASPCASPRAVASALGVAAAGALLVVLPHFGSSLVFYRNPFYPFLQNVFPSWPTVPGAAAQMNNIVADWHAAPAHGVRRASLERRPDGGHLLLRSALFVLRQPPDLRIVVHAVASAVAASPGERGESGWERRSPSVRSFFGPSPTGSIEICRSSCPSWSP